MGLNGQTNGQICKLKRVNRYRPFRGVHGGHPENRMPFRAAKSSRQARRHRPPPFSSARRPTFGVSATKSLSRVRRGSSGFPQGRITPRHAETATWRCGSRCRPWPSARRAGRARPVAAVDDADLVGVGDRREAVGDDQSRAPFAQGVKRLLNRLLGLGVERRGRLVEQDDRRVFEEGARDGDALALAAGELQAVLAAGRVVAALEATMKSCA